MLVNARKSLSSRKFISSPPDSVQVDYASDFADDRKNPQPDEKSVHYSSSNLRLIHSRSVWILASDSESLSAS